MDNVCAFLRPGEVVLAWTDDETDPQYPLSQQTLAYLEGETDARGRKLVIHKLPIPDHPVCITEEELAGTDLYDTAQFLWEATTFPGHAPAPD